PTAKSAIFPNLTFISSVKFRFRYTSIKSCAIAPEDATISPDTVPKTVAKATAEIMENKAAAKARASNGADILLDSTSNTPLTAEPKPMYNANIQKPPIAAIANIVNYLASRGVFTV